MALRIHLESHPEPHSRSNPAEADAAVLDAVARGVHANVLSQASIPGGLAVGARRAGHIV